MENYSPLFDVKVNVRSLVKLLPDIKAKLKKNTNRYNLFKSTVFGPWLDVPHKPGNDSHLMNYVLQYQVITLFIFNGDYSID